MMEAKESCRICQSVHRVGECERAHEAAVRDAVRVLGRERVDKIVHDRHLGAAIPFFKSVKEIACNTTSVLLLVRDPFAGLRHRYNVLRIDRRTGCVRCVGNELPLKQSRTIMVNECEAPGAHGAFSWVQCDGARSA